MKRMTDIDKYYEVLSVSFQFINVSSILGLSNERGPKQKVGNKKDGVDPFPSLLFWRGLCGIQASGRWSTCWRLEQQSLEWKLGWQVLGLCSMQQVVDGGRFDRQPAIQTLEKGSRNQTSLKWVIHQLSLQTGQAKLNCQTCAAGWMIGRLACWSKALHKAAGKYD